VLRRPWAVIAAGAAVTLAGVLLYPLLGTNLFPTPKESSFSIEVALPPGATLSQTDQYVSQLEAILAETDGVSFFTSHVGETEFFGLPISGGVANQARIKVSTDPGRRQSFTAIMSEVKAKAGALPGEARVTFTRESLLDITGLDSNLELVIEGESLEQVREICSRLVARLAALPSMGDVKSVLEETRPEIHVHLDHRRALQKGVTVYQVATVLRQAMEGLPVARIDTGGDGGILNLVLGLQDGEIGSLDDLEKIGFYSPSGAFLRLGEVATFTRGFGPASIPRENQRVVGIVQAQYFGDLGGAAKEALQAVAEMNLSPGCGVRATGTASLMREVFEELWLVLFLAALLVYLVMAAQFESFLHPFMIICSLPLAFTGAVLALLATGNSLSVPALIGAVVLAGILVNDGIIMVDLINQKRRLHGVPLREAIIEGAAARLRPILMTTITTVLGLVPLALGLGQGSQLQAPMAIVIIGGQISGTALLLFVIPAIYHLTGKD
jgi:HAE1 family hydrophobic/amphiphilic exporter-1